MGDIGSEMSEISTQNDEGIQDSLRSAWDDVLRVDEASLSDKSFLSQGGDSLAALQLSSKLLGLGHKLSVYQIMEFDNFQDIATAASGSVHSSMSGSASSLLATREFELSPAQHWILHADKSGGNTFQHQSLLLLVRRDLTDEELRGGMRMLVETHPMLRARFHCLKDGEGKQFILDDTDNTFFLRTHFVTENAADYTIHVRHAQHDLDAVAGPVFGADLFRVQADSGTLNILSLKAHQLVIDPHSWNIITQDLEDWLEHGKRPPPEGTSFSSWVSALGTQAKSIDGDSCLITPLTVADSSTITKFWGIENATNTLQDVREYSFIIDPTVSTKLLNWQDNGTCVIDVLLGALLFSFSAVFGQEHKPNVFIGEHGRDKLAAEMETSRTVGCFGTFSPVTIEQQCPGILEAVRQVRKARTSAHVNGLSYFSTQLMHPTHRKAFYQSHLPVEIMFHYRGSCRSLGMSGTLFEPYEGRQRPPSSGTEGPRDRGASTARSCLIDVLATKEGESLKFRFEYNRKMRRQQHLFKWFGRVKSTCVSLANEACSASSQTGQPLAPTHPRLPKPLANPFIESVRRGLRDTGLDLTDANLEDAYACPPVQQGMLVSMLNQRASIYDAHLLFRFNSAPDERVVSQTKLESAWQKVIYKHTMLRTVFVESSGDRTSSPFCMGVLRKIATSDVLKFKTCTEEKEVLLDYEKETQRPSNSPLSALPLACLTIYQVSSSPRSLYCYLRKNHLMMDAISSMNIITELLEGYAGKLDEDVVPYADYVKYVERQTRSPSMDKFWGKYLEGLVPCWFPALTALKERKGAAKTKTTELIPLCDTPTIQNFCRKHRLTVSNIAYAAWALTLSRYTNQTEVCFGYPVSGRALPVRNIEKIIGPIINMNILRSRVGSQDVTALELVQSCQNDLHKAMPFQTASLPRIYRNLGMQEHQPFNTIMDVQRTDVRRKTFDIGVGARIDILDMKEMDEYDLALAVCDGPETLSVRLNFSTAYLSDGQAAQVMSAFGAAVRALVSNPSTPVRQLSLVDSSQKSQIAQWNRSNPVEVPYTLDELVRRNSLRRPLASAIQSTEFDILYSDLDNYSHRLAQSLVFNGVGPGTVVTLCFEKSVWAIVAMCGVQRAGGAFSHVDPSWPQQRIRDIVARTRSTVGITSPSMEHKVSGLLRHVLALDMAGLASMGAASYPELDTSKPSLQDLAYVISTSGSTGKPKIVAIPQVAISTALSAQVVGYKLNESSRVAQFASYVFDSSILEIFGTLLAGGCVCVPSEEERMSDFAGFVQRMNVNLLDVTPSLMRTLSPADVPSVTVLSLGGEALNQSDVDTWAPHTYLINTYGPSEASVNAAISHRLILDSDASNIGFGVGCKLWVVDPANHNLLAPIGAVGELLIDGPILASGYFGDDAETSGVFVSDVAWQQEKIFSGIEGECGATPRLYKTGDLVRYNVDGSLNFLGRRDAQIKVRGYRIERQEIEHQIRSIPGLEHVAVFDGKEGRCKGKLVAVVSLRQSDDNSGTKDREHSSSDLWQLYEPEQIAETARFEQSIRRHLASPLPSYMIPDLLLIAKRLPLLVSYKVDLKTLERAVYDMDNATFRRVNNPGVKVNSNKKPGTDLEERLRLIWGKVLEVDEDKIDLDESFFALGGDSVTAMKVTRRCRESGLHMMTHDLLAGRTIRGLASRILNRDMPLHPPDINAGGQPKISPHVIGLLSVEAQDVDGVVPATPFQNQVYHASRMHPGKPYFATYLAQMTTDDSNSHVDINTFSRAWQSVVDRHPIMRTLFMVNPSDGTLYQITLREARAQIEIRQVEDGTEAAKRLWVDHHAFSHELTTDSTGIRPGLAHRIAISRARSGAVFLTLSLSHLITDTVALEHMFADLDTFYKGASPNKPSVAFADYAKWFETHAVAANNKTWQEQFLRGAQSCYLLQPRNRPLVDDVQPIHEVSLPFSIPSSQRQAISDFCRVAQVTVPNLFLFCWGLLLKRYTQQSSVCFGQLVAGRDAPVADLEDIVGPVLSVLPIHVDLSPSSAPLLELMQQFQKTNSEAMVNQPCSLKSIEKLMGCSPDRGLFNTVVNIRKVHYQEKDLELQHAQKSLQFRLLEKYDALEYDFVLQVDEKGGNISGALTFWNRQFEVTEVKGLLDAYLVILEMVLRSLEATVSGVFSKLEKCHR